MNALSVRASTWWSIPVLCAAALAIGWQSGYRTVGPYIGFLYLATVALLTGRRVVQRVWATSNDAATDAVRTAIIALATIIGCGLVLGGAGALTPVAFALGESAVFAVSFIFFPPLSVTARPTADASDASAVPAAVAGVLGALAAFAIVFAATHAPATLYDSLSYHLFFSARWLQEHAITIVPTPFSDVAQAYAPGNGELFFAWLMLPFHGDVLARMGQLPFACLAAISLFALARRLGIPREGAIYPSIFLLMARPIVEQAVGADVDLICAALFLVSVHLALVALDSGERRDWLLMGVAAGLYVGTKYLAIVYLPVLLVVVLTRRPRAAALWALPGVAAFGLPWYARNWIVAGSPLYPASLQVAGMTVARGAFDRAAMLDTVFHATSLRLLPIVIAHAMGATLFLLWIPCVATALVMARRFRWTHAAILAVPVMIVALCWAIVPVNVDSRFMMPAVPFALLPFGFLFRTGRVTRNRVAGVALLAGMLWIVIGYRVELPVSVPWFMEGWLKLDGLVPSLYLTLFAPVAVGIALAWRVRPRWVDGTAAAVSLILAGGAIVAIDSAVRCPQTSPQTTCEYVWATSPRIRPELFDGWRWIGDHVSDATVAYTGMNLPYPLTGRRLTNRVVYANIDGRLRWRFHDYDRALRQNRFTPTPPLLATSSGELLPAVRDSAGGVDALRPRYERLQGIREAWENNLIQMHTRWLFIASLSAYERDYVWHDELDFPIEQTWAMADPAMFHLEYENPGVRVYSIRSFA